MELCRVQQMQLLDFQYSLLNLIVEFYNSIDVDNQLYCVKGIGFLLC